MEKTINSKEKVYFVISLLVSVFIYFFVIISIIGAIYALIFAITAFIAHGIFIGNLKGNGIKISEQQFPEAYQITQKFAKEMNLTPVPEIYVIQEGGMLNAFATKFLGRSFLVVFAEVLELAYEEGEEALSFVISHELAHIKRKHLSKRSLLLPAMFVPFLGSAYSRACEYTCDMMGAYLAPEGATSGLLVLAAGKKLYQKVNMQAFSNQVVQEGGFWVWLAEIFSSHPHISKRIQNLMKNQVNVNQGYVQSI